MSDTYAEDARLDREAEREEFEEWCDSLDLYGGVTPSGYIHFDDAWELEPRKEEEDGQSTSSS